MSAPEKLFSLIHYDETKFTGEKIREGLILQCNNKEKHPTKSGNETFRFFCIDGEMFLECRDCKAQFNLLDLADQDLEDAD